MVKTPSAPVLEVHGSEQQLNVSDASSHSPGQSSPTPHSKPFRSVQDCKPSDAGVTDGAGVVGVSAGVEDGDGDGVVRFSLTQPQVRTMQISDSAINPVNSLRFSTVRNLLSCQ